MRRVILLNNKRICYSAHLWAQVGILIIAFLTCWAIQDWLNCNFLSQLCCPVFESPERVDVIPRVFIDFIYCSSNKKGREKYKGSISVILQSNPLSLFVKPSIALPSKLPLFARILVGGFSKLIEPVRATPRSSTIAVWYVCSPLSRKHIEKWSGLLVWLNLVHFAQHLKDKSANQGM